MSDERTPDARDRKLGQRVRTRRLEIGMSQERLAEALGVTFQQVQKYEKGVNRIAATRLLDIADALDMPAAALLDGLQKRGAAPHNGSATEETLATPDGVRLALLFDRLKARPRVQRRLVALAEAVAGESA